MARVRSPLTTEFPFKAEISEDAQVMLNDDIFCLFDKPSKVGPGATASGVPNDYV